MSKYIDADKLIAEIERLQKRAKHYEEVSLTDGERSYWSGEDGALILLTTFITSLQQDLPEVQNGKFVFPKYLYARSKDNKIIDMSYAPQDMTAIEYIRNDFVEQEQPDVDLEKEIKNERSKLFDAFGSMNGEQSLVIRNFARHFYELGLNARKED